MIKREKTFFTFSHYIHYAMVKREKSFFTFSQYVHYAMIKRKKSFFLFQHYIRYPMVTRKRNWYLFHHYLDYANDHKNIIFSFHYDIHCANIFLHLIKLLTYCKSLQTISSPEKYAQLKNFVPQEFQWSLTWFTSQKIGKIKYWPIKTREIAGVRL